MDRQAIIRIFLEKGSQVDKNALDILFNNQDILQNILKLDPPLPTLVTSQVLDALSPQTKLSINELSQMINYRYKKIEGLLARRSELENLVSINKINSKLKRFSVIGMVLEVGREIIVEDPTGQASFKIADYLAKYLVEDEVIGIVCETTSEGNKVSDVVYPDIPLRKDITKTPAKCAFISDLHMDSPNSNTGYYKSLLNWLETQKITDAFLLGGISERKEDIEKLASDIPNHINMHRVSMAPSFVEKAPLQLFIANGEFLHNYIRRWGSPIETTLVNLVKKRNLNPVITQENYNNSFLLEKVPDIIMLWGTDVSIVTHYKGTTIITNGNFLSNPVCWAIDLETRETYKTDFS